MVGGFIVSQIQAQVYKSIEIPINMLVLKNPLRDPLFSNIIITFMDEIFAPGEKASEATDENER
jgi:hypothetical protein